MFSRNELIKLYLIEALKLFCIAGAVLMFVSTVSAQTLEADAAEAEAYYRLKLYVDALPPGHPVRNRFEVREQAMRERAAAVEAAKQARAQALTDLQHERECLADIASHDDCADWLEMMEVGRSLKAGQTTKVKESDTP